MATLRCISLTLKSLRVLQRWRVVSSFVEHLQLPNLNKSIRTKLRRCAFPSHQGTFTDLYVEFERCLGACYNLLEGSVIAQTREHFSAVHCHLCEIASCFNFVLQLSQILFTIQNNFYSIFIVPLIRIT